MRLRSVVDADRHVARRLAQKEITDPGAACAQAAARLAVIASEQRVEGN